MKRLPRIRFRRGGTALFSLCLMIVTLVLCAFAVDWGYLMTAKSELQRSADSAALAAAWELIDEDAVSGTPNTTESHADARSVAVTYAGNNIVCTARPVVDPNTGNSQDGDVVIGHLSSFTNRSVSMTYSNPSSYNAVKVRVRRVAGQNGEVPLFFARMIGINSVPVFTDAMAGVWSNMQGFTAPSDGSNLSFLPIALDLETWNKLLAQQTSDDWTWDPATETISAGADGVWEANLFPQPTGQPGNRGTVDVGGSDNSTAVISRQIRQGVTKEDLAPHGGQLVLDENGQLFLNGDTGISAAIKDDLNSIMGQPKIIPIFSDVQGPGNNAMFTIVQFAGVRILEVKLTGSNSSKRVIIQPANNITGGVIPYTGEEQRSQYIYSRPVLVR